MPFILLELKLKSIVILTQDYGYGFFNYGTISKYVDISCIDMYWQFKIEVETNGSNTSYRMSVAPIRAYWRVKRLF